MTVAAVVMIQMQRIHFHFLRDFVYFVFLFGGWLTDGISTTTDIRIHGAKEMTGYI